MAITQTIQGPSVIPNRVTDTPEQFSVNAITSLTDQAAMGAQQNTYATQANALAVEVNDNAAIAESAKNSAVGAANYKGDWTVSSDVKLGESYSYLGKEWVAKQDSVGVTPVEGAFWIEGFGDAVNVRYDNTSSGLTATNVQGVIDGLGTAATADLTTSNTDATIGRVLKVGDGGWMGQGVKSLEPYGYPTSINAVTNKTKVIRSEVEDNGVTAANSGIHFSSDSTWGRLRVGHSVSKAWIQGGRSDTGTGWTSQVVLSDNILQTTGSSTELPMSQAAVTNQLLGVGQTWQDVKGSRSLGSTWTNNTGRTIQVSVTVQDSEGFTSVEVDGSVKAVQSSGRDANTAQISYATLCVTIPAGGTYVFTAHTSSTIHTWTELR